MKEQGLTLNSKKTKELRISTKDKPLNLTPVTAKDGSEIEVVSEIKLLGLWLSDNLKWNLHVDKIVATASSRLYLLTVLKTAATPKKELLQFYFLKIRSIITYAFAAICNMPKQQFQRLEKIERRAERIIGMEIRPKLAEFIKSRMNRMSAGIKIDEDHRLKDLLIENKRKKKLIAPIARTTRYKDSFIKYFI